jgi:hypothetical protein
MDRLASAVEDWVELQKPVNTYVPPTAPSVITPNEEKV